MTIVKYNKLDTRELVPFLQNNHEAAATNQEVAAYSYPEKHIGGRSRSKAKVQDQCHLAFACRN